MCQWDRKHLRPLKFPQQLVQLWICASIKAINRQRGREIERETERELERTAFWAHYTGHTIREKVLETRQKSKFLMSAKNRITYFMQISYSYNTTTTEIATTITTTMTTTTIIRCGKTNKFDLFLLFCILSILSLSEHLFIALTHGARISARKRLNKEQKSEEILIEPTFRIATCLCSHANFVSCFCFCFSFSSHISGHWVTFRIKI